jgi:2-keto-4-pentenoate hydratase
MKRRGLKWVSARAVVFAAIATFFCGGVLAGDIASLAARAFLDKEPVVETDPAMSMEQALAARERFLEITAKGLGGVAGYKAGLTNPAAQKAFGVSHPVRGTLFDAMFLKSGVTVPADFGTRSFSEGDLAVRVGDERMNSAKTPDEALRYIDAVIPCIELADLVYDGRVKLTAAAITLINVGARFFVLGEALTVEPSPEWRARLKGFTVKVHDEKDVLLAEGKGENLLGDPLNVVLWIKDSLVAEGKRLKKGDVLSLGSVTKIIPSKAGSTIRATYTGLDPKGPVDVRVRFK